VVRQLFEGQVVLMAVTIGLITAAIVTVSLGVGIASAGALLFLRAIDIAHRRWCQGGSREGYEWDFLVPLKGSIIVGITAIIVGTILTLIL